MARTETARQMGVGEGSVCASVQKHGRGGGGGGGVDDSQAEFDSL